MSAGGAARKGISPNCTALHDLTVAAADELFLKAHGLTSLDALFSVRGGQHLSKPGLAPWRERLRVESTDESGARVLYLKRFTDPPRSARRDARRCGARSVAGVEWRWLHELAAIGVPTARPVAFGEEFRGSRERRSAVLMAAAPGVSLERRVTSAMGHDERERLLAATARLVGRLHGAGIVHRDLYLSHMLWHADERRADGGALTLIDLQRVCRPAWRLRRWVIKDLAALSYSTPAEVVSRSARLRWLIRYQAECAGGFYDSPTGEAAAPGTHESDRTSIDPVNRRGTLPRSQDADGVERVRRRRKVDRVLVYRIAGKVSAMARHDARRRERLDGKGSGA